MKAMDMSHGERKTLSRSTRKNRQKYLLTAAGCEVCAQRCPANEIYWRQST